jgi:hypothetical protein
MANDSVNGAAAAALAIMGKPLCPSGRARGLFARKVSQKQVQSLDFTEAGI